MNEYSLKVKDLWLKGKSISEIENLLDIKIDVSDVAIPHIHKALLTGAYTITIIAKFN